MILAVIADRIAVGDLTAVEFAFQRILGHAANNLFGKLGGIKLSIPFEHGFQQNAFRAIRNILLRRNDTNTILLQNCLVASGIIAVACEAVELPDNDHVEQVFCAVLNHTLKIGTVIRFCRKRAVDIIRYDVDTLSIGKLQAFTNLSLYGFLTLIVGGVSCIDDAVHPSLPPESKDSKASLNFACMAEDGSKHISINCFSSGLSVCVCVWYSYSFPCG